MQVVITVSAFVISESILSLVAFDNKLSQQNQILTNRIHSELLAVIT